MLPVYDWYRQALAYEVDAVASLAGAAYLGAYPSTVIDVNHGLRKRVVLAVQYL